MISFNMFCANKSNLKLAIFTILVVFSAQGILVSYSSVLPETKSRIFTLKAKGNTSTSHVKKSVIFLALLKGTLFVEPSSSTSSIDRVKLHRVFIPFHSAVPVRAPPVYLS